MLLIPFCLFSYFASCFLPVPVSLFLERPFLLVWSGWGVGDYFKGQQLVVNSRA